MANKDEDKVGWHGNRPQCFVEDQFYPIRQRDWFSHISQATPGAFAYKSEYFSERVMRLVYIIANIDADTIDIKSFNIIENNIVLYKVFAPKNINLVYSSNVNNSIDPFSLS